MKRRSRMGAISSGAISSNHNSKDHHGTVIEHIPNLITVFKDGHVERPPTVPTLHPASSLHPSLTCHDVVIDPDTHLWARLYLPKAALSTAQPTLIYFHGGGFCVGSASWSIYHLFLSRVAAQLSCSVLSVNYRLAPEHRLPAAYHDGVAAVKWARQQKHLNINMERMFLAGDSAGANVAYNTALTLGEVGYIKGLVMIEPFFGSERRTWSERHLAQGPRSALSLPVSDSYWRMALPRGADRDHGYCNPMGGRGSEKVAVGKPMMVCVAGQDILRDGNMDFCREVMERGGKVETSIYEGVGHAFQVLDSSSLAEARTTMLLNNVKAFVNKVMCKLHDGERSILSNCN